ncbi:hypothetical protein PVK06_036605 [Gossypium arboreum]|uniref:DUF4283 domain-containing protein n=1 Tax=Gossypium arboreum TaxID=29729 RepID=A0ABR0NK08_GOSAR|nr:hypothetical protein PVK06_036605 [Gossypium arboreum]
MVVYDLCLVGCFLTTSVIHFPIMRSTMANLWHPLRGLQISDLGDKRFLFRFFHKMDIDRVLNKDPWAFNNHLLVIHRLEGGEDLMKVRIAKGLEFVKIRWYLSLKAHSRRAAAMNSVWLREEGEWEIRGNTLGHFDLGRDDSWNLLRNLRHSQEFPCLVCGDFNDIMYSFEKVRVPREERRMKKSNRLRQKRFQFETRWVMEESFEEEVKSICQLTSGDMLAKLEGVRKGLVRWVSFVRNKREDFKRDLTRKLEDDEKG